MASDGDDGRTGEGDWTNAVATISNGVSKAFTAEDTVLVSNGTYEVTTNIYITTGINVLGLNAPTGVVITTRYDDPAHSTRCVRVNSAGAVFAGFTVAKGYPAKGDNGGQGGEIYVQAGLVSNCVV